MNFFCARLVTGFSPLMVANFKKNKKSLFSQLFFKVGGVAVIVFCLLLIIADIKVYTKHRQLNAQISSLQQKISNLQIESNTIEKEKQNANNSDYIEQVAREELDMQRPGETVVSFVGSQNQNSTPATNQNNLLRVWAGWLSGLFGK